MTVIHSNLFGVIKRFPSYREVICNLFKADHNFVTLCDDYRVCHDALKFWSLSDQMHAAHRTEEYEALLKELEDEILQTVRDFRTD